MKTQEELLKFFSTAKAVDAHVHTHLCDGSPDATVANIAASAENSGIDTVVLTPHFHKAVADETEALYADTDETILLRLREEIEEYREKGGSVRFLLSVEADILSPSGETALSVSRRVEEALDLVTPTMNYHPLLPLRFVHLTYGRDINELHDSGEFALAAEKAGGIAYLLRTMYEIEANAIKKCPYPAMLGHFFAAHSVHPDRNTWFGAREEDLPLMKEGALRVIAACKEKGAMLDLTGVHLQRGETVEERLSKNGFLVEFQRFVADACRKSGLLFFGGSDAHSPGGVGGLTEYYNAIFS